MVQDVTNKCDLCKRYKHSPPKPAVCFPLATEFNESVALDLKVYRTGYMLHMIDHATRYSPNKFLSDNGGEFINEEFNEMAEKINITILTTA